MKKILILTLTFIAITVFASAQNNVRNIADFNALKVSSAFNVELIQGNTNQVEIIGVPDEFLANLATELSDNQLSIYAKGKIKAESDMKIKVTFVALEKINISGASNLKNQGVLTLNDFNIKSSGASNIDLNLKAQKVTLISSGASDVKLKGATQEFNIEISGASELKTETFEAEKVVVNASGASDLKVLAVKEISGSVSGASDLKIFGNPAINTISESGASDVRTGDGLKISVGVTNLNDSSNVSTTSDTTKIKLGRTNFLVINDSLSINRTKKKRRNHWAGVDLGINGFVNNQGNFNLNHDISLEQTSPKKVTQFMELDYAKSWVFSLNFYEHYFKIAKHHFGFVTGLGLEYNNYELKHNVRLIENGGSYVANTINAYNEKYTWGVIDSSVNFSKNRFKTFYIDAPFLFEINTGEHKNKSFHLSAGAIVGYKFTTRMKYVYKLNGDEQKISNDQDFNTNPFKVSLTARAGIGRLNFFATYALTPLFEIDRGPELYPFSVGVTLLGF